MDSQTLAIIMLIVYLLIGIVFCFFGNRWIKIIIAVYGFVLGFLLASTLLPAVTSLSDIAVLLISLGAGVVGAVLFVLFFYAGIFFIGFGGGVLLCLLLIEVFSLNIFDWYVYIPVLIVGCILGSITLNKRRIFVSIFTAFIGASALAQFIYHLTSNLQLTSLAAYYDQQTMFGAFSSTVYLITLAALFVAGLVIQLTVTSKKERQSK